MDRREFIKTLTAVAVVGVTRRTTAFGAKANEQTQVQEPEDGKVFQRVIKSGNAE